MPNEIADARSPASRAGLRVALHGPFDLPKSGGRTAAVEIRNGKVTSVGRSSITLKSEHGRTKTCVPPPCAPEARPVAELR